MILDPPENVPKSQVRASISRQRLSLMRRPDMALALLAKAAAAGKVANQSSATLCVKVWGNGSTWFVESGEG